MYMVVNTETGRIHTGYYSFVSPKIYTHRGHASSACNKLNQRLSRHNFPPVWTVKQIDEIVFKQ